jgi:hypothetical protein
MNPTGLATPATRPPLSRGVCWSVVGLAGIVLLVVFFRCVFHLVSGWDCPGCGGQRALHQLLHGNLGLALRQNALFILLLPVGGWYLFRFVMQKSTGRTLPSPFSHHLWPWILCVIVISFGLVRNLPGFDWLRP